MPGGIRNNTIPAGSAVPGQTKAAGAGATVPALAAPPKPANSQDRALQAQQRLAAQRFMVPALLDLIRGPGFDFNKLQRIDQFLGTMDFGQAEKRHSYLGATLSMIIGSDLAVMDAELLCYILHLVCEYLGLTEQVGQNLLGEEIWKDIPIRWGKAVAALKKTADPKSFLPDEPENGVVVVKQIGGRESDTGSKIEKNYASIIGRKIGLASGGQEQALQTLRNQYPYAKEILDRITPELRRRGPVFLGRKLIWGPPGIGKTKFWISLCQILGIPHLVFSCGGKNDSTFGGGSRQWTTGEPAAPVLLMAEQNIANPVIILDEIDKIGTGKHNGGMVDVLLGMMGEETAKRWSDPYLQAPVDLSRISWLATANDMNAISEPLKNRFESARFNAPRVTDTALLVQSLWADLLTELGEDNRMIEPLAADEVQAIAKLWKTTLRHSEVRVAGDATQGLSVRHLKVILRRWVDRREGMALRH